MKRLGLSMVEVLVGVVLACLLLGAAFAFFRGGLRDSREALENHQMNDDVQRIVDHLENDIREAGAVSRRFPPFVPAGGEEALDPASPRNKLVLFHFDFDFAKDPSRMTGAQKFYTRTEITWSLAPTGTGTFDLVREEKPADQGGAAGGARVPTRRVIARDLTRLVFYRLTEAGGTGPADQVPSARCIFVAIDRQRPAAPGRPPRQYNARLLSSLQVRGAEPEGF